ncbi:hypothetical protein ACFL2V_11355 [Pseudomonadota bacterium]
MPRIKPFGLPTIQQAQNDGEIDLSRIDLGVTTHSDVTRFSQREICALHKKFKSIAREHNLDTRLTVGLDSFDYILERLLQIKFKQRQLLRVVLRPLDLLQDEEYEPLIRHLRVANDVRERLRRLGIFLSKIKSSQAGANLDQQSPWYVFDQEDQETLIQEAGKIIEVVGFADADRRFKKGRKDRSAVHIVPNCYPI